jgi:hypothetical protein
MAACWVIGGFALCGKSPEIVRNNATAPVERFECEARAIEAELPLPTEAETIGIDFILFEPLPAPIKNKSQSKKRKSAK